MLVSSQICDSWSINQLSILSESIIVALKYSWQRVFYAQQLKNLLHLPKANKMPVSHLTLSNAHSPSVNITICGRNCSG